MMARFCCYVEKVFGLGALIEQLSDARRKPQIPTSTIFLSAFMMFVTRLQSLNAMEGQLRVPGRWEKVVGKQKPSADRIGEVGGLMDPEQLRDMLSSVNHRLRRNKVLDKSPWPLRFVALDGHEFFASRIRHCDRCCQRQITIGKKGKERQVTEYYHRGPSAEGWPTSWVSICLSCWTSR